MARGRHPTRIHIDPPDEQARMKYLRIWYGGDVHRDPHRFPGLTSPELFGNDRPLEIDFGCGTGVLMCGRAEKYPDVNFLGIDQSQKPLFCAVREAVALSLNNVKFIRGDFEVMLALLRPQTISAAYYLFPNPPQDYHLIRANVRRRSFLQTLYGALVIGGRFYFATDSTSFFGCMNGILRNELRYTTLVSEFGDPSMSTRYRRIWEERGRNVKSFTVEKGP
jgi:tRNA (guanine-N7-)-methyltransferase